jgi:hypothetical protein
MAGRRSYKQIVEEAVEDGVITWADIIQIIAIIEKNRTS